MCVLGGGGVGGGGGGEDYSAIIYVDLCFTFLFYF